MFLVWWACERPSQWPTPRACVSAASGRVSPHGSLASPILLLVPSSPGRAPLSVSPWGPARDGTTPAPPVRRPRLWGALLLPPAPPVLPRPCRPGRPPPWGASKSARCRPRSAARGSWRLRAAGAACRQRSRGRGPRGHRRRRGARLGPRLSWPPRAVGCRDRCGPRRRDAPRLSPPSRRPAAVGGRHRNASGGPWAAAGSSRPPASPAHRAPPRPAHRAASTRRGPTRGGRSRASHLHDVPRATTCPPPRRPQGNDVPRATTCPGQPCAQGNDVPTSTTSPGQRRAQGNDSPGQRLPRPTTPQANDSPGQPRAHLHDVPRATVCPGQPCAHRNHVSRAKRPGAAPASGLETRGASDVRSSWFSPRQTLWRPAPTAACGGRRARGPGERAECLSCICCICCICFPPLSKTAIPVHCHCFTGF